MVHRRKLYKLLVLSAAVVLLLVLPVQAAERIYFNYGLLGRSVTIEQLATFAKTGELEGSLALLKWLSPERRAQIQAVLQLRYPVDPIMVDRFAYTSSGERLFRELGELIQSEAYQNGARGLRSAAILATANPDGVSIIGFLQQFPTDMRIDLRRVLAFAQRVSGILKQTQQAVVSLNQQTAQAASQESGLSFEQLPDLRQSGSFVYQKQSLNLYDTERQRQIFGDLYLPITENTAIPVIVMSNGLGAGRDRFDEIAHHLASHGFAIATLDHPGSDRQRLREFYAGLHRENFDATEYLDRPKDISFLLDQLEQLNQTQLGQRLNLERVGIFGYSFGGSTALSLAGAEIDFAYLQQDCQTETGLVNISLIYQCRALELPRDPVALKDERIQAAFMFVPFGKSLFGTTGMAEVTIPIFWEVTDLDILTPLVVEQLPTFAALTTTPRYLSVTQGLPHARVTYDILGRFTAAKTPWEDLKAIAHSYQNALSLAFFKLYIEQDEQYRSYLTAAYAKALTQAPYSLSLVQTIDEEIIQPVN
nr:MAG: alpha/beta hydrolase [Leptolyngbya sp. IPPAS B-1204]